MTIRYSSRPLPSSPYLPGVSPRSSRPSSSPDEVSSGARATPLASEAFHHGVDLYNHGFPWEAHEEWEPLWFALPRDRPDRVLLQGLIHVAAAAIKARTHGPRVACELVASACEYLAQAHSEVLDVPALIAALHAWSRDVSAPPPRLVLTRPAEPQAR